MFNSNFFTPKRCEAGVPVKFNLIKSREDKLSDIISTAFSANTATLQLRDVSKVSSGLKIDVRSNGTINPLYLGKNQIDTIDTNQKTITYKVYNQTQTLTLEQTNVTGSVYSVPNIENSPIYLVNFSVQSSVPANDPGEITPKIDISITPSSYSIVGSNDFYPEGVVKIKSKYTDSSKVLLKLTVSGLVNSSSTSSAASSAKVIYTDYQEIVCAQAASKPCEIIARAPKNPDYIFLNKENNWTYTSQQFHIARLIPDKSDNNSIVRLEKRNDNILPNRQIGKFKISIDPIKLAGYVNSIDITDVRRAFYDGGVEEDEDSVNQYVFIIADSSGKFTIDSIKKTIVGYYYIQNGANPILLEYILVPDEQKPIVPVIDTYELPSVAFLRYNHNGNTFYIGELIFLKSVYYKENILVQYLGQELCGQIIPAEEGITELSLCAT